MRKSIYFAFSAFLSVLFAGCANTADEYLKPVAEESGAAVFTFTPDFGDGPETRAMSLLPVDPGDSDNPSALKNIFFAVFDAEGYKLAEYAEAIPNSYAQQNGVPYTYSVRLTVTNQKRIIHIIANAPENMKYGSEEEVIGSLCTYLNASETGASDRQDAYWERIVLENGVHAEPDIALKTDNPAEYDRQYAKYKEVVDALGTAHLVRNFASIAVVKNKDLPDSDFLLTGFMLVNVPDRGSIAPYNRNLSQFQQEYGHWQSISDMIGDGEEDGNYQGFTPAETNIIDYKDLSEAELVNRLKVPTSENVCEFCYEREVPESDPLYVIIAGKFHGSTTESYYKVDLKDQNDRYFPILRNFHYRVNIESVKASGAPSIKAALEGLPSGGNISTSLDLQKLNNISNGDAQLIVSSTEEVICNVDDENDYILWYYKFIPDLKHPEITENLPFQYDYNNPEQRAEFEQRIANHLPYLEFQYDPGEWGMSNGVMRSLQLTADGTDGYQCVKFFPNIPGDVAKTSVTTLIGHYWTEAGGWQSITRSLKCTLRKRLEMKLEVIPVKVPDDSGQELDLRIGIESGLPEAVFSLDFQIESRKRSLSANITAENDEELPVATGKSTIPDNVEPAFWFTKAISYEDYLNTPIVTTPEGDFKFFTCHFKTLKPVDTDEIYVSNPIFVQNHTSYSMFTASNFSNLAYSKNNPEVGENLTFSFDLESLPSDRKVMVSMHGLEKTHSESQLEYKYSDDNGYEIYEMTVTQLHNSISVSPYAVGTAIIKIDADEYYTAQKEVTARMAGSQSYTIEANSVNIYRIISSFDFGSGTTVSVYYSDPQSSSQAHATKTFTVNSNKRNNEFTIDAIPGSILYFSVEYGEKTYFASASVNDLNSATNSNSGRFNLSFNTNPPTGIVTANIPAGSILVQRGGTNWGSANVYYYFSDPKSGSPTQMGPITTTSNGYNNNIEIACPAGTIVYFKATYKKYAFSSGTDYYGSATIEQLDAATTSSWLTLNLEK